MELLFHAFLPERFVLHTHPPEINAVTCNRDGAALAARLFGDEALWVPYTNPGLPLARAIVEARRAHVARTGRPAPPVTLMQNHGIIVAADTPSQIDDRSAWLGGDGPLGDEGRRVRHGRAARRRRPSSTGIAPERSWT